MKLSLVPPAGRAHRRPTIRQRAEQRGIVLLIALIALVALTMAGIAFMRSVDTAGLIAGNLAFSRASVAFSDVGMEQARTDMAALAALSTCGTGATPCLEVDQPTPTGLPQRIYYRNTWQTAWSYQGAPWDNTDSGTIASPTAGYTIRYIVHRMCQNTGPVTGNNCVTDPNAPATAGGIDKGSISYGGVLNQGSGTAANPPPYYRVTIRVQGPRNSVSYIQAWLV